MLAQESNGLRSRKPKVAEQANKQALSPGKCYYIPGCRGRYFISASVPVRDSHLIPTYGILTKKGGTAEVNLLPL